jgi:formylmethanofuran dehydrogenase subunit E
MSEFIRCDSCGDLSSFEDISYINNTPLCSVCQDEKAYLLLADE